MNKQSMGLAVITGASAGIGAVYADRLARRGYDLLLVARNTKRMDKLADRLPGETGRKIELMTADLNQSKRCRQAGTSPSRKLQSHPPREQRGCGRYCAVTQFAG